MTVLLTTHYMEEADLLCDRVALMHVGVKRAEGALHPAHDHAVVFRLQRPARPRPEG
jgi:ABC-type multidrug transport system ATPase subunit